LKEGDVLIYRHTVVDQGLADGTKLPFVPANAPIEIGEVYSNGMKLKVGRARWENAEKVVSKDNGLRYGFPLKVGMKWDNEYEDGFKRYDHGYCKYVEKIADVTVPAGTFKSCFVIVHRTCPEIEIWWYCPGVGVVKYKYHHNGTITNEIYELKKIIVGQSARK